jgi:hypothetical protein
VDGCGRETDEISQRTQRHRLVFICGKRFIGAENMQINVLFQSVTGILNPNQQLIRMSLTNTLHLTSCLKELGMMISVSHADHKHVAKLIGFCNTDMRNVGIFPL